jgi:glyoxylate/hydroxypyruvate reductase A
VAEDSGPGDSGPGDSGPEDSRPKGSGARGIMALMFLSFDDPADAWRAALLAAVPDLDFRIWPEVGDPAEIDLALVWQPPPGELARYPNLRAILSLGAGIDGLLAQPGQPDVPVARMVDPSLTRTMTEYVVLAVLRHHRQFDHFEREQRAGRWSYAFPPQAADRRVGIMGLGVLGGAAALSLASHGFPVAAWSRTGKELAGIEGFAGEQSLAAFLARTDILVCLLPLTADTAGILNAATFAGLPPGACLINVARGGHLVEADLIAALDSGQLAGATLDVFREEPLPPDNPLWRHPKVLITPHVASYASPLTAAEGVAENIRRARAGQPLLHQVDRGRGY